MRILLREVPGRIARHETSRDINLRNQVSIDLIDLFQNKETENHDVNTAFKKLA